MPYTDEVLADSPFAYWRLGEAAGATTIADSSGNSRSGAVANPTGSGLGASSVIPNQPANTACLIANPGATPYAFGGTAMAPLMSGTSYSVELWVNVPVAIATLTYFLERGIQLGFSVDASNRLRFTVPYNTSSTLQTSGSTATLVPIGQPVHIVGTAALSGTTLTTRLYINGSQVQTGVAASVTSLIGAIDSNLNSPLTFGARSGGNLASSTVSRATGVTVDDIALYSSELSASRILAHYNAGIAPPAPVNTAVPTLSGTFKVGETVSSSAGSWSNSPTSYSYQWQSASSSGGTYSNIAGATSSSFTLTNAQSGLFVRCQVTASNAGGSASALTAASTQVVPPYPETGLIFPSSRVNSTIPTSGLIHWPQPKP